MRSRECGSWECRSTGPGRVGPGSAGPGRVGSWSWWGAVLLLGGSPITDPSPALALLGHVAWVPIVKRGLPQGPNCGIKAHCPQTLFSVRPFRIPPPPLGPNLFLNRCRNLQVSLTSLGRGKVQAEWAHICAGWGTGGVEEAAQLAGPRTVWP